MSPMIKPGDPPVPLDVLSEARASLPRDHGFAFHREDGRKFLLARAPEDRPDPPTHLEALSFNVGEDDLRDVHDILLVGDERVVRVDPVTLRDIVRERATEDEEVEAHLRKRLEGAYDYTVFRHQETRDHLRLGVRIPRSSVADVTPDDVQGLRDEVLPVLETEKGREIRAFYVVADEDAERLSRRAFLHVLDQATPSQDSQQATSTPSRQQDPAPTQDPGEPEGREAEEPPGVQPQAAPSPTSTPQEAPRDDGGADLRTRPTVPPAARAAGERLREAGYEVLEGVEHGGHAFDLAAHRPDGSGKRLLVRTFDAVDADTVAALEEAARELDADAVLALYHGLAEGAREASWGTRVTLVPAGSASELRP